MMNCLRFTHGGIQIRWFCLQMFLFKGHSVLELENIFMGGIRLLNFFLRIQVDVFRF